MYLRYKNAHENAHGISRDKAGGFAVRFFLDIIIFPALF